MPSSPPRKGFAHDDRRADLPRQGHLHCPRTRHAGAAFPRRRPDGALRHPARRCGQETLTALHGADRLALSRHARGDNASALICAATLGDALSINGERVRTVAVTGNSMGWSSALACGGAVSPDAGFAIASTMGRLMQAALTGGQLVYPWMGRDRNPTFVTAVH
ncbi:MAG: hypothetical protein INF92_16990 [Rhodobacter sp.]|nr:hypothetical protein [Rhodobacter sp.]